MVDVYLLVPAQVAVIVSTCSPIAAVADPSARALRLDLPILLLNPRLRYPHSWADGA